MDFLWVNIFRHRSSENEDPKKLLQRVPLFADLNASEMREFVRISHSRTYRPGEVIFFEGEPGVGMYVIRKGEVEIRKAGGEAGEELVLARLKDGDFFGELALLDDSPRSASAVAATPTELIGIFRPDLLGLLERKPRLGIKVLLKLADMIGKRLKATNTELQKLRDRLKEVKGAHAAK